MREILFRGKRINNGDWTYGNLIVTKRLIGTECYVSTQNGIDNGKSYKFSVNPSTVGQYTGLIDKNGKKIFEGDIIKIVPDYDYSDDYTISKVYSYNGIFCVDYHGDDFDSTALGFLEDYLPDGDFEVIGNIHDNPELLEVEK